MRAELDSALTLSQVEPKLARRILLSQIELLLADQGEELKALKLRYAQAGAPNPLSTEQVEQVASLVSVRLISNKVRATQDEILAVLGLTVPHFAAPHPDLNAELDTLEELREEYAVQVESDLPLGNANQRLIALGDQIEGRIANPLLRRALPFLIMALFAAGIFLLARDATNAGLDPDPVYNLPENRPVNPLR